MTIIRQIIEINKWIRDGRLGFILSPPKQRREGITLKGNSITTSNRFLVIYLNLLMEFVLYAGCFYYIIFERTIHSRNPVAVNDKTTEIKNHIQTKESGI